MIQLGMDLRTSFIWSSSQSVVALRSDQKDWVFILLDLENIHVQRLHVL